MAAYFWESLYEPPLPGGYTREYTPLGGGEVYWHLFYEGRRVNGGLSQDQTEAEDEARRAARCHNFAVRTHW